MRNIRTLGFFCGGDSGNSTVVTVNVGHWLLRGALSVREVPQVLKGGVRIEENFGKISLSTSKPVFPSYQGESTIFDTGKFLS